MSFTFNKNERLHEFRLVRMLFTDGHALSVPAFKVTWLRFRNQTLPFPQVMISVPKVIQRKSTDRNTIKRRIREAYRLNKSILYDGGSSKPPDLIFCITYLSKEILPHRAIQDKIILLLRRLKEEYEKDF